MNITVSDRGSRYSSDNIEFIDIADMRPCLVMLYFQFLSGLFVLYLYLCSRLHQSDIPCLLRVMLLLECLDLNSSLILDRFVYFR